jgi:hypothetical protein
LLPISNRTVLGCCCRLSFEGKLGRIGQLMLHFRGRPFYGSFFNSKIQSRCNSFGWPLSGRSPRLLTGTMTQVDGSCEVGEVIAKELIGQSELPRNLAE